MSDAGRESITDKIEATVVPNNQKSLSGSIGDTVKGKADNVAADAQPENEKSLFQKVSDTITGTGTGK